MKKILMIALSVFAVCLIWVGCANDAMIASQNLSQDADMFRINRRVVFYNGITDKYILTVEGRCSINIDTTDKQLELTCKTGENTYKKHFLGLSDNVTYFAEQLDPMPADVYHYKVIFKPASIIPNVEVKM